MQPFVIIFRQSGQPLTAADLKKRSEETRTWAQLPAQAVKYVRHIEELIERPVTLLSTSPEREDTILVRDPFEG